MARVAVVTGGTRGIGAAISKALSDAGHKVAANYGGNDEAGQKFKGATGIPSTTRRAFSRLWQMTKQGQRRKSRPSALELWPTPHVGLGRLEISTA
jgi:NAD(P)-dependent dehydrogenase (short-subunit alcohol dehydrogenase family)